MKSKKPRHLKAVASWVPSEDAKIIAALEKIVKAIKEHPEEDWPRRLKAAMQGISSDIEVLDAKTAARNASPIYRRGRQNKIRIERAGKVRGMTKKTK